MNALLVVVVALATVQSGLAHQGKLGRCKAPTPMANFEPERLSGTWYVIEKLVTSSDCLMAMFNLTSDNTFSIQELRAPMLTQSLPLEVTFTNVGTLQMDPNNKAKMSLKWDGNFVNRVVTTSFVIVATDYDSYAMDVECQDWTIFHRISATIYSRTNSLPEAVITDLRNQLRDKHGIDLSRMNRIDHAGCHSLDQTDYNIKFDENGLSLLGLLTDEKLVKLETDDEVKEYLGLNEN